MKDMTEEMIADLIKDIKSKKDKEVYEALRDSGVKAKIPRSILCAMISLVKYYEAESVADVYRNYRRLSVCRTAPPYIVNWFIHHIRDIPEPTPEFFEYKLNHGRFSICTNLCTLDSVLISDIKQNKRGFKAVEFRVYDIKRDYIPGVFCYDEKNQEVLEKLLLSTASTNFDIAFFALDERNNGRMINVIDIRRNKAEGEESSPEPTEDETRPLEVRDNSYFPIGSLVMAR